MRDGEGDGRERRGRHCSNNNVIKNVSFCLMSHFEIFVGNDGQALKQRMYDFQRGIWVFEFAEELRF